MKIKKIISMILLCAFLLSVCSSVMATNENSDRVDLQRISSITDNATAFLNSTGYENTPSAPIPMYNLNEEVEALYYPLQPIGYLIASYKDGHVIEFSPKPQQFADISGKLYYNGIMEYYKVEDDANLVDLQSNNIVNKKSLRSNFDRTYLEQIPSYDYQPTTSTYGLEPNNPTPINFVSTSDYYYCVITAVTNLLQYYHDFMNADVYAENVKSVSSLRKYLNEGGPDNGYVYEGGTYLKVITNRHNYGGHIRSGLQAYFNRADVDTYTVNATAFGKVTIKDVKTQLNTYARPVVLGMNTSAIDPAATSNHAVLAYTYMETANTTYFITNDGWGNNFRYICVDDISLDRFSILYLS